MQGADGDVVAAPAARAADPHGRRAPDHALLCRAADLRRHAGPRPRSHRRGGLLLRAGPGGGVRFPDRLRRRPVPQHAPRAVGAVVRARGLRRRGRARRARAPVSMGRAGHGRTRRARRRRAVRRGRRGRGSGPPARAQQRAGHPRRQPVRRAGRVRRVPRRAVGDPCAAPRGPGRARASLVERESHGRIGPRSFDHLGAERGVVVIEGSRARLTVIGVIVMFLFSALFARLWFLQVASDTNYAAAATNNRIRVFYEPALRGRIVDRNDKPIVDNEPVDVVTFDRHKEMTPAERKLVVGRLAGVLGVTAQDVELTLDADIQRMAEQSLAQGMDGARQTRDQNEKQRFANYRAGAGAVVALDPNDGSVVAMASNPTYDPRQFAAGITPEEFQQLNRPESNFPLVNRAVQGLYAPGSTFKPFTAIAGLQTGQIDPNAGFSDQGCLDIGNEQRCNAGKTPHGTVNLPNALTVSSDTYFYNVGRNMWQHYNAWT